MAASNWLRLAKNPLAIGHIAGFKTDSRRENSPSCRKIFNLFIITICRSGITNTKYNGHAGPLPAAMEVKNYATDSVHKM